ncbi:uncharacterized protein K02A2.6-like [Eupeodes corollae]|uniref:uncharacterized protein K02A2.6-like n=1 Tax=Eupeodes corollae TaxID=290404 RepID=UPI0024923B17|nr:uncharacterized protein K02A2.6-like [Eupeodes corollae]
MDATTLEIILKRLQDSNQEFLKSVLEQKPVKQSFISSFKSFDKSKETWATYLLQLEQHFIANNVIEDDTKRACLLSWIGGNSLDLLQKFYGEKVAQVSFGQLIEKLTNHFEKKPHMLASRFKFYRTFMQPNQTYSDWVAELRGTAKECMFVCEKAGCGESYVDSKIRDMIILYTPHDKVRSTALQKENPTLEEVIQIAQLYEETMKTCSELKGEQKSEAEVNAVHRSTHQRSRGKRVGNYCTGSKNVVRQSNKSCPGCDISHQRSECFHYKKNSICKKCKRVGHIAAVCMSSKVPNSTHHNRSSQSNNRKPEVSKWQSKNHETINQIKPFETVSTVDLFDSLVSQIDVNHSSPIHSDKLFVDVSVNEKILKFQIDTGASCSLIGLEGLKQLNNPLCLPTTKILKTYGGNILPLKGTILVDVALASYHKSLSLTVVDSPSATNILGMDWFQKLEFGIQMPKNMNECSSSTPQCFKVDQKSLKADLEALKIKFQSTFSSELGLCSTYKANIVLKPNAQPKFYKPYNLPFALYEDVRTEINRLVSQNILKPVNSITVNPQIEIDRYPIPRIEELFHKLSGGQLFTKIDLSDAYLQIELTESSKKLMVINTPFGLFQFERLPFGIASAPGIFQRIMEGVVAGIPGCAVYLDDVIVTGKNNEEHRNNVETLLNRLAAHNLKCRQEKCHLAQDKLEYVGHEIDAKGIRPTEKRIEAIKLMPEPKNITELESFIGKINYYNKFIQNFSSKASALNQLRRHDKKFVWGTEQSTAFNLLKNDIINAVQLIHFDENVPLVLATDASKTGIGAVLSHRYSDGTEKPISFASKTLNEHQAKYSQIEREALSIIFGVTRYHQYLYGRQFILLTDHQALVTLFHPSKKLPVMTLHRLQRWAIILQAYSYTIHYRNTKNHANADVLSRLPMGDDIEFDNREKKMFTVDQIYESVISDFPISAEIIAAHTKTDETLSRVIHYIQNGWPQKLSKSQVNLIPYFHRMFALSLQSGVLLLQTEHTRVVIPKSLEDQVLKMLHEGHLGQTRMKQLARRYIWFPNIDQAIKNCSEACSNCGLHASQPKQQYSSWPAAAGPWERIHIDFAGPFFSRMWLIVIDSFSSFPFIFELSSTTTESTIYALQKIFAIEGLPSTIVSDNGPQFSSAKFKMFCKLNSIEHVRTAPFHPASNGLAERAVRTFKESFKKMMQEENDREKALYKYLITYRATPIQSSKKSPSELLHGRQPRTIFSAMFPENHQSQHQCTKFEIGQKVYARSYIRGNRWIAGLITKVVGRMMFIVQTSRGNVKRHQNQLRARKNTENGDDVNTDDLDIDLHLRTDSLSSPDSSSYSDVRLDNEVRSGSSPMASGSQIPGLQIEQQKKTAQMTESTAMPTLRRTGRIRKKPVFFPN